MSRSNKFENRKNLTAKPVEELLEIISTDMIQTAKMSFDDWQELNPNPFTPLAIPVSPGHHFPVTQNGVNAAHELTEQTWQEREDFRQTVTRNEFDKLSFTAIGQTILNSSKNLPENVENDDSTREVDDAFFIALATDYTENLNQLIDQARHDIDRHIQCHLFHDDQKVPAFSVGPVDFRPRQDWIDRFVTDSQEHALVMQVEKGELHIDELRRQAFLPEGERTIYNAWTILSSLGNYSWVATLRLSGHGISQSHQKASIIVGLAIDAIGLRFHVDAARRFTKSGRQHLFVEDRLATSTSGSFLHGTSVQVPGLASKPGEFATKMLAEREFLDAAGTILEAYVQGRQSGKAQHLVERWVNALYWVGEARRETSDFMAVVNYGCAADGLSGAGGNAIEMTKFAKAALNPKEEPTPTDTMTIEDAVSIVYREGRNKLAHGEMSGLLEDLSAPRVTGDSLLVSLFDAATIGLADIVANRPEIFDISEKHAYRAFKCRLKQRAT